MHGQQNTKCRLQSHRFWYCQADQCAVAGVNSQL